MELKFTNTCWRGGGAHCCCALVPASLLTSPLATLPQFPHPKRDHDSFVHSVMRGRHSRRHFREIGWRAQRYHLASPVLFPFLAGLRSQAGLLAGQVQEHVAKGSSFLHWPSLIALVQTTRKLGPWCPWFLPRASNPCPSSSRDRDRLGRGNWEQRVRIGGHS